MKTSMIKKISMWGVALCFASCASTTTEITGSWKAPVAPSAPTKVYNNILVAALTNNIHAKNTVEADLAAALSKQGLNVKKSIDMFPPNFTDDMNDKSVILDKIRGDGVDAILTVSLIDKETDSRYVPGNYDYAPFPRYGYYGRFWGYYSYWYPRIYTPGYYVEDKTYYIETNLYDAQTEQLIWSAQSQTYNPSSLDAFSKEFASIIASKMRQENVIV